ncbi:MAG TPA: ferredoxin reductase family protein [Acidimicrobiales bacterium]|nr:ferredoxin reductase family protein [Acidimicrobiales bacterium]
MTDRAPSVKRTSDAPQGHLATPSEPTSTQHHLWTHPFKGHRTGHIPLPVVADVFAALAGIGLGATIALVATGESHGSLAAPGGWLIAASRMSGFVAAYLMLLMLLLIARLPWLERSVGQDRLVKWHRRIGPWPLGLVTLHVVLVTLGYAQLSKVGPLRQLWIFLTTYPDVLAAAVAFGLLLAAGFTSIKMARQHLKYESWWAVHLYTYLALALAFAHQIATGVAFIGHPLTRIIWSTIWLLTAGVVLVFRVLHPIARNLRIRLRVESVCEEAPGVFAVVCSGRHVERLAVSGGQFFQWRFLAKGLWWHSHPYSLSALPRPPFIRVTIKGLGDQSNAVAYLKPGVRVFIEGPYGAFTRHTRTSEAITLIGAGVGITPLRALLEDLPESNEVTVVIRASSVEEIAHRDEFISLLHRRGGHYHEVVGSRRDVRLDVFALQRLVPNLAHSDVYICGPQSFNDAIVKAAKELGAPRNRIHLEEFSF